MKKQTILLLVLSLVACGGNIVDCYDGCEVIKHVYKIQTHQINRNFFFVCLFVCLFVLI